MYHDYPQYPFDQSSGRPVRANTSQSPQQPPFQPAPSYPPYSPAPYPHAQQWQPDSWPSQQYTQPLPIQPEIAYPPAPPRADAPPPAPTPDPRAFPPPPQATTSPPRTRRKDKDSPAPDFAKMQESYRLIMDNANSMMGATLPASRLPPGESIDRMLQSASHGMQMLQSAMSQSNPDVRPVTSVADKDAPASKRQKGDEQTQEGQTCLGCNATSTPEWRRGPLGPRTLCNACGLVYAKLLKKRARGEGRSRPGDSGGQSSQHPIDDTNALSSGGSEDEDSYGSQDRRSDFGDHGRRVGSIP